MGVMGATADRPARFVLLFTPHAVRTRSHDDISIRAAYCFSSRSRTCGLPAKFVWCYTCLRSARLTCLGRLQEVKERHVKFQDSIRI